MKLVAVLLLTCALVYATIEFDKEGLPKFADDDFGKELAKHHIACYKGIIDDNNNQTIKDKLKLACSRSTIIKGTQLLKYVASGVTYEEMNINVHLLAANYGKQFDVNVTVNGVKLFREQLAYGKISVSLAISTHPTIPITHHLEIFPAATKEIQCIKLIGKKAAQDTFTFMFKKKC